MDALDPTQAPGVGTPVYNGLTQREAFIICEEMHQANKLIAIDVVETNPLLDKRNMTGILASELILACTEGIATDGSRLLSKEEVKELLFDIGEAFIKPSVETGSGKGCSVIDIHNGIDSVSGETVDDLLKHIGNNYVVQERLVCHSSIQKIYSHSVNTFRVSCLEYLFR